MACKGLAKSPTSWRILSCLKWPSQSGTETSCVYAELAHEGSSWSNNLHKQKEVKVSPHMAESGLRVLVDNSTVWTEGHLLALSLNANQLPHQAPMSVEVHQQELPVCAHVEIRRYYDHQAGQPGVHEGG